MLCCVGWMVGGGGRREVDEDNSEAELSSGVDEELLLRVLDGWSGEEEDVRAEEGGEGAGVGIDG